MTSKIKTVIALATAAFVAAGTAAVAQTATPDTKPAKKTMKHHARKSAAPPTDMYLRAAGSEPAPKAAK
jgi:hypothetical protein